MMALSRMAPQQPQKPMTKTKEPTPIMMLAAVETNSMGTLMSISVDSDFSTVSEASRKMPMPMMTPPDSCG